MITVIAHLGGGATATSEHDNPRRAVDYMLNQPNQPAKWEVSGTPDEEAAVFVLMKHEPKLKVFFPKQPVRPGDLWDGPRVTNNAVLLLGFIGGSVDPERYSLHDVRPGEATCILMNTQTGNLFRVRVDQIGGTE